MFFSNWKVLKQPERNKYLAFVLILFHAILSAALLIFSGPRTQLDSSQYIQLGENIANGVGFGTVCGATFYPESVRMPGYPILLALDFSLFGANLWPVVVFQSLLSVAAVIFVWRAGVRAFGNQTGLIFLALSAFYPFVAYFAIVIMTETICVFLVAAALYFFSKKSSWNITAAGILISLSYYFRPNLVFLGIAASIVIMLISRFRDRRPLLILTAAAVLGSVPWMAYNYHVFHRYTPFPVVKGTGFSLFISSWQSRVSTGTLVEWGTGNSITSEAIDSGFYEQTKELKLMVNNGLPEGERVENLTLLDLCDSDQKKILLENHALSFALDNIKERPLEFSQSVFLNTFRMWFTVYGLKQLPNWLGILFLLQGFLSIVLAFVGCLLVILGRRRYDTGALVFVSVILYFLITLCLLHTEARYTLPGRLPMLMLAAHAVAYTMGKPRRDGSSLKQ
jgi:4-amino-4-deoxy-L-arabinose transferase-like glycosyltransferase